MAGDWGAGRFQAFGAREIATPALYIVSTNAISGARADGLRPRTNLLRPAICVQRRGNLRPPPTDIPDFLSGMSFGDRRLTIGRFPLADAPVERSGARKKMASWGNEVNGLAGEGGFVWGGVWNSSR